jgi:hypothetical protein
LIVLRRSSAFRRLAFRQLHQLLIERRVYYVRQPVEGVVLPDDTSWKQTIIATGQAIVD